MKLRRSRIGGILAAVHLFFVLYSIYIMEFGGRPGGDDPTTWIWMIWGLIDFPLTVLVFLLWSVLPETSDHIHVLHQAVPIFVHGILGTVWWYFLPSLFMGRKGRQDKTG